MADFYFECNNGNCDNCKHEEQKDCLFYGDCFECYYEANCPLEQHCFK